jgi:hypothetical protein
LAKKNIEFGLKYQADLWLAHDEVDKLRQLYEKASKESEIAQKKYDEALKKPKTSLQSLKTLVTGKDVAAVVQKVFFY